LLSISVRTIVTDFVLVVVPQLLVILYEIVAVPPETPVTTPPLLTVATPVLLELHVPLLVASAKVMVAPTFNEELPVISATVGKVQLGVFAVKLAECISPPAD